MGRSASPFRRSPAPASRSESCPRGRATTSRGRWGCSDLDVDGGRRPRDRRAHPRDRRRAHHAGRRHDDELRIRARERLRLEGERPRERDAVASRRVPLHDRDPHRVPAAARHPVPGRSDPRGRHARAHRRRPRDGDRRQYEHVRRRHPDLSGCRSRRRPARRDARPDRRAPAARATAAARLQGHAHDVPRGHHAAGHAASASPHRESRPTPTGIPSARCRCRSTWCPGALTVFAPPA